MNDTRADARIIAIATLLAQHPNRPAWIKAYDPITARLTIQRYRIRASKRTLIPPRDGENEYQRYLRSREWYDFRLAIMALAAGACAECGQPADEVHHLHYRTMGNESPCDVMPLCEACHRIEHQYDMRFKVK